MAASGPHTARMAEASAFAPSITKRARPVRVQAAIDEVTQERVGHAALFGVALPEAQNLLLPLRINAQRDHDRVVTQHDPVDQHDRELAVPERRGEPASQLRRRQGDIAARDRALRCSPAP